jgi:hypothetical protein
VGSGSSLAALTKEGKTTNSGYGLLTLLENMRARQSILTKSMQLRKYGTSQCARKTNVEWRVVFAKLGGLSLPEIEGKLFMACPIIY